MDSNQTKKMHLTQQNEMSLKVNEMRLQVQTNKCVCVWLCVECAVAFIETLIFRRTEIDSSKRGSSFVFEKPYNHYYFR